MANIENCLAYLDKLPAAVSGAGGHQQTFAAALACRRFGLSEHESYAAMQTYNARCSPPWSEKELRHKVASVFAVAVQKPIAGRSFGRQSRAVFVAPQWPARPVAPRPVVPVCQRSEEAEEAWWTATAADLGLTLEEFDIRCGAVR